MILFMKKIKTFFGKAINNFTMNTFRNPFILVVLFSIISSCAKQAGPGGSATVKGKLYARNFDSYGSAMLSQYYISGENVYICYGNDDAVRNNVKSSIGG